MSDARPIRDTPINRRQLALIAKSKLFYRRQKLLGLLEYLATETMAGREARLSQEQIAAAVSRVTGVPQAGITVRTGISRLRNALAEYYRNQAKPSEIIIGIPPRRFYITAEQPSLNIDNTDQITSSVRVHELLNPSRGKQISQNDITGQQGINLIERICLKMGFVWYPTKLDAGIDGYIEIRQPNGDVTNCIIQVQSKATARPFDAETHSTFEYRCTERDLDYWLGGNAPVILICSRPSTDEAYWVSLKEYFDDPARRKNRKITFDKTKNRFDTTARDDLQHLGMHADAGLYLATSPKHEVVYSNLLRLAQLPDTYYMASTEYRTAGELFARFHELTRNVHGDWILHDKVLTSFHDMSTAPWSEVTEPGTLESHDTDEWANTEDPARKRLFVQLLNTCLKEKLYHKGVKFSHEGGYYYFRASQERSNIEYAYASREHNTSRTVFKGYPKKSDQTQISYYRHSAFEGRFVRYGGVWYLEITPTYHFTRDGVRLSRYAPDLLSGINRLENNQAVHGQIVMWAHLLTARSLFDVSAGFVDFTTLQHFEIDAGLHDNAWLKQEDNEQRNALQLPTIEEQQQQLL